MLVGLIGKKRSGKDTVAAYLVKEHGFIRVAFADALKEVAEWLNPLIPLPGGEIVRLRDHVARVGWEAAKENVEVRRVLQELGLAVRNVSPGVWIRAAFAYADVELSAGQSVVVTDVRFPDEIVAIRERGGELWRVERPGSDRSDRHVSETILDGVEVDRVLRNDQEVVDLWGQVRGIIGNMSESSEVVAEVTDYP
jgi:hypothetical protein